MGSVLQAGEGLGLDLLGVETGDRQEESTVKHHINTEKRQGRKCGVKEEEQKGETGNPGCFESHTQSNPTV